MKKGIKTNLLFELVKVGYLNLDNAKLKKCIENESIQNSVFISYLAYHGLRPIAYKAINTIQNQDNELVDLIEKLKAFNFTSTFQNLRFSEEICKILNDQQRNGIRILAYKGNLFLYDLYKNNQLRECGDVDFLIHPDDIEKSLNLFLENGYKFHLNDENKSHLTIKEILDGLITQKNDIEISLLKNGVFLDIHWGLHYLFLYYKIDYEALFQMSNTREFYGKTFILPNAEAIFWMIINHHGAKELWLRMKHLVDLMAFMQTYGLDMDWEYILNKAKKWNVFKVTLLGFYLIHTKFEFQLPKKIVNELKSFDTSKVYLVDNYINGSQKWDKTLLRIKYERILINFQDDGFSRISYFKEIFKTYSRKTVLESPRLIEFPERFYVLNFMSKVLTYIWRKTF